jgi:4-amino-4-deoxy-L-arabinose transferase-like glycosyltransferase
MNEQWHSGGWRWLALLALLVVFALLVFSISSTYMRDDEEIAFRTTAQDLGFTIWYQAEQDVHAPVWFVSFWFWQQVAGTSEFTARIYSILLTMLTLALLVQLGRRWFGAARFGIFAVLVFGVNAYAHIYALEIRPYALGMLLATVNMLLFQRWLARPRLGRAVAYGASVALLLWTHYFLAFLVLAQLLYLLVSRRLSRKLIGQGVAAAGVALLLWSPWLPVFVGQVETLRRIETETGAFRGLGIGNTTQPTTPETIWRLILLMTNGQPLLYLLPLLAGLVYERRHGNYGLALTWALAVPLINLLVNLVASVHTPRYLSYIALGVAVVVGAGLASLPRGRWFALGVFAVISLWALPSQLPTDRTPLRQIFQSVSTLAQPGDAVYFTRADDADLFTRWQIDHYLAPELRANQLDSFEQALDARAVWFITGDYFHPETQARFAQLEATHPLQAVAGDCNRRWCYLAQRLLGPPEETPQVFGDDLLFYGVDPVMASPDEVAARLWWGASAPLAQDYSISLQLLNANGMLVAQRDGPLDVDTPAPRQTSALEPGRIVLDNRVLTLDAPLPSGEYQLLLIVYQPWDNVRLTLRNGSDTLSLRTVNIP